MTEEWIVVPNWERFQHYKDRNPPWIKLYLELRDKDEWRRLTLAEQGLLVNVWILYCSSDGLLTTRSVPSQIPQKVRRRSLDSLRDAGFIELRASKPLAHRYQVASPETETETEKKSIKKSPKKRRPEKVKAKARAWIDHTAHELRDVDLEQVIADEFRIDDPELLHDLVAYATERIST